MNFNSTMKVFAVVLGLYGLLCIIFPEGVFRFFGYEPNSIVGLCNRDYGSSYVSWAVLAWVLGSMNSVQMKKNIALVHVFALLLSGFVTLYGALTHNPSYPGVVFNYIGVAMYFIFVIPFAIVWWRLSSQFNEQRRLVEGTILPHVEKDGLTTNNFS